MKPATELLGFERNSTGKEVGSGDFAPHFQPSVPEVKSMKKELVVK
jgi:hypothetical protein